MQDLQGAIGALLDYCRGESWAGYDPYDGLNSPVATLLRPGGRLPRTLLTQIVKRSPVNIRPLLGIKKGLNAKGLALAARAVALLSDRFGRILPADVALAFVAGVIVSMPVSGLLDRFRARPRLATTWASVDFAALALVFLFAVALSAAGTYRPFIYFRF